MKLVHVLGIVNPLRSPPLRGRGLKLVQMPDQQQQRLSPPLRGRGLKP